MYSFIYTNKRTENGKDEYLLHITLDDVIVESLFVQFPQNSSQEVLDNYANGRIDYLEGLVE